MEDMLEMAQEKYIRLMLEIPVSTPKISLRAETGILSMHIIWFEKVNLILAIRRMTARMNNTIYFQAIQYQYNTRVSILQYNTIPIPMQYQICLPPWH